jgi:hypothetical protein
MQESISNTVDHPKHYNFSDLEVIDVIDSWNLNFYQAKIIKYLSRYKYKNGVQDLKKAAWYLDRLIVLTEKNPPAVATLSDQDPINRPAHYTLFYPEVIDIIDAWHLNFYEGQILDYIMRYPYKNGAEDLKKAMWYLNRLIQKIQKQEEMQQQRIMQK